MPLSDPSPPDDQSLRDLLRHRRTTALIADAQLIRDARPGPERDGEARRSIHDAMLLFALRKISRDDRDRILTILSFAIPPEPLRRPDANIANFRYPDNDAFAP